MRRSGQKLPDAVAQLLEISGYTDLYPPQAKSVKAGLVDGKNVLVSAPTASGKTLMAMMAMASRLARGPGKAVYLSPLRALAAEKFSEFKILEKLDVGRRISVAISTGDYDGTDRRLARSDILILTNEKMDSIIRRRPAWLDDIGLVVADEIHLVGDPVRGPTLEMVLTAMKMIPSRPQIVGLSATITNANELARWLGATLVRDKWRPVPLSEGVCDRDSHIVKMQDGTSRKIKGTSRGDAVALGIESVIEGGQALIFADTRARAASAARRAAAGLTRILDDSEKNHLEEISKKILKSNDSTDAIEDLAGTVRAGAAFHHAGLNQNCRETVESEFRSGRLKIIASTPTLASGVNLPARRVVVSSVSRYDFNIGTNVPIPVMEYKQICGRAGRPQYDEFGEAIIVCSWHNADSVVKRYIRGMPEPIESGIAGNETMQVHVLSLIVISPGIDEEGITWFFLKTLGGLQSSAAKITSQVRSALGFLVREGFVNETANHAPLRVGARKKAVGDASGLMPERGSSGGPAYRPTRFGSRVSKLYIRPGTAVFFRDVINGTKEGLRHDLGLLHAVTSCDEFFPKLYQREDDTNKMYKLVSRRRREMVKGVDSWECNRCLLGVDYWMSERTEAEIADDLNIESGDMHKIVEGCDWLLYCLGEVAKVLKRSDLTGETARLRVRVKYGIKEDLMELVRIRGVGRVRARRLRVNGIRDMDGLAAISEQHLAKIDKIGPALATKIKAQVRGV